MLGVAGWMQVVERFMVAAEKQRGAAAVDAVAEVDDGMVHFRAAHARAAHVDGFAGRQGAVLDAGRHGRFADGKIAALQLHCHHVLDAAPADAVKGAMQAHAVAGHEQGREHGQAVDVVPVAVRDEDVRVDGLARRQLLCQRKDAAARIENDQAIVVGARFDARGVAAVARRARAGGGDGAAHTPEREFHSVPCYSVIIVDSILINEIGGNIYACCDTESNFILL
ncbi:hypothetical protein D3C72_1593070 [compost metagenome]